MARQWPQRCKGRSRIRHSSSAALSLAGLERVANTSVQARKPVPIVEALEAEIRRLRAENAKLLEQREVLKKSLGILSEVPHRGMPESNR